MSALLDILGGLLGNFWPYLIAAVAALLGILGLHRARRVPGCRLRGLRRGPHRHAAPARHRPARRIHRYHRCRHDGGLPSLKGD